VYVVKYWSDAIPIQNNMKNNIALRFVLEYAIFNVQAIANPSGCSVLRHGSAVTCWDCGFESRRGHGCLSLVTCVSSGRDPCNRLITRPEESYWVWCVQFSVIMKPRQWGGPDPFGAVMPLGKKAQKLQGIRIYLLVYTDHDILLVDHLNAIKTCKYFKHW